jgi:hypothetical protein
MSDRTFSLEEAHDLLPVLEGLLRAAISGKRQLEQIDKEFQAISHKVFLAGGTLLPIVKLARRKAEREKFSQRVKDAVTEINSTGVQVKDLDIGLLDFPCEVDRRTILLCWKMGETKITHWHGTDEGYGGRKPIDQRMLRPRPEKSH